MHERVAEGERLHQLIVDRQLRHDSQILSTDLKGPERFDRVIGVMQVGGVMAHSHRPWAEEQYPSVVEEVEGLKGY